VRDLGVRCGWTWVWTCLMVLVAFAALGVPSALADGWQPGDEPLTGIGLYGGSNGDAPGWAGSVTCALLPNGDVHVDFSGTSPVDESNSPFEGTSTVTGSATISGAPGAQPLVKGMDLDFVIHAAAGFDVTGTISVAAFYGGISTCSGDKPYILLSSSGSVPYTATFTGPNGTWTDTGGASLYVQGGCYDPSVCGEEVDAQMTTLRFNYSSSTPWNLSLSPSSLTGTVDTPDSIVAHVSGGYLAPGRNVTVRFGETNADEGDGTLTPLGSCVTDETGTCTLTYRAPAQPEHVQIVAYPDYDLSNSQGRPEFSAFADRVWQPGVPAAITSASSATAALRTPFDFDVTATGGPLPALTESGALPAGVTFMDNGDGTADIAGTPAAGGAGAYPVTITATNGEGAPASQHFTLTVLATRSLPVLTSGTSDSVTFGEPFSFPITTTGYPVPKISKVGALPTGVTLTDNGDGSATLAGTPAKAAQGTYQFTLNAKNSQGTATQTYTLVVFRSPTIAAIKPLKAQVGTAFLATITATGFDVPRFRLRGLPSGLFLTDARNGTATIAGTPDPGTGGSYSFTLTASNGVGTDIKTISLTIAEAPAFTSGTTAFASLGTPLSFPVTATGFPAPKLVRTGTLPKGITFQASTGTFSGTPKAGSAGSYPVTLTASNASGTATQTLTIVVS
jgi:Putative Ig domain